MPSDGRAAHPREALVNETFVRRYLPGLDPIGREVGNLGPMTPGAQAPFRIVGVVGDVRSRATQLDAEPQVYRALGRDGVADAARGGQDDERAGGAPAGGSCPWRDRSGTT